MDESVIAVFDVGKTNKKLLIFSEQLELLDSTYQVFESTVCDGLPLEDLEGMEQWFFDALTAFATRYPIRAIAVTTHGAGFVCLGPDGNPSLPMIDYTYEPGGSFHDDFYELVGDRDELQKQTATLELKSLVNPAKGLFFLKRSFPEDFEKTRAVLFFPQYWTYRLTGQMVADYTYAGCHTYLWDFHRGDWSVVADRLGVRELLPERATEPWSVLGRVRPDLAEKLGLDPATIVTPGIHDSNASLLPYLIASNEDLVLNSTGTWCVAMHPDEKVHFSPEEIGKSVFFNLSAFGKPVKTTILLGGLEFESFTKLLQEHAGRSDYPDFNPDVYRELIAHRELFVIPGLIPGTGQFPDTEAGVWEAGQWYPHEEIASGSRVPPCFADYERAYAAINLSVALQSQVALERVGLAPGVRVYTEGGFRKNSDYNALVQACFPESPCFLTDLPEATAFGAAMTAKIAADEMKPEELAELIHINPQAVETADFGDLPAYQAAFLEQLSERTRA